MRHETLLTKIYDAWLDKHGYEPRCALELRFELYEAGASKEHTDWLERFSKIWEECESTIVKLTVHKLEGEHFEEAVANFYDDQDEKPEVVEGYYIKCESYGELCFFKHANGFYETVIERESIYTEDFNEVVQFCRERA